MKLSGAVLFAVLTVSAAFLTGCAAGGSTAAPPPVGSPCAIAEQALSAAPLQLNANFAANSAIPFTLNAAQFGWPSIGVNMDTASVAGSVTLDIPTTFPPIQTSSGLFIVGARLVFSSPGNTSITFAGPPYGLVCASAQTNFSLAFGELVDARGHAISDSSFTLLDPTPSFTIARTVRPATTVTPGQPYYYMIFGVSSSVAGATAPLAIDKPAVSIIDGNNVNVTVSEPGYTGNIAPGLSCPSGVSVTPAIGTGPSATFTITALLTTPAAPCAITFTDSFGQVVLTTVTITAPGPLTLAQPALALNTGQSASLTVSETNYVGSFDTTTTCAPAVISFITPFGLPKGPSFAYTITAGNTGGTCSITFVDIHGGSVVLPVTVTAPAVGALLVSSNSVSLTTTTSTTVTVSETSYSGAFTPSTDCAAAVATVTPGTATGPSAIFTITAGTTPNFGTPVCHVNFADNHGGTVAVNVTTTP
jgi:hypothetical protein